MRKETSLKAAFFGMAIITGCHHVSKSPPAAAVTPVVNDPCAVAMAPLAGDDKLTQDALRWQAKIKTAADPNPALERLGWYYVKQARRTFDPGYYKLAEQCALCMESRKPNDDGALLLRGHVMHSLHRFKDSEDIARQLTGLREMAADFGLLGDVLMEQGKLDGAVTAYTKMMSLRPDMHAYARAAHMRWLKGDLTGAIEAMQLAARASSPNDPESAAWVFSRLGLYQLQAGDLPQAGQDCLAALQFQKDYAPALLVQGRILLAQDQPTAAGSVLQRAAELNPLPEYHWVLAEALRAAGRVPEAAAAEAKVTSRGVADDPRTLALFLATRQADAPAALQLAEEELKNRADVFTYDALAWAEYAAGKNHEALAAMDRALAEGTQDGRLFLHAAVIASANGDAARKNAFIAKATALQQMLYPSERNLLAALPNANLALAANHPGPTDRQP